MPTSPKILEIVEQSFRSMVRETIFVRPPGSQFKEDAIARALRYLEPHLMQTGIEEYRKRVESAMSTAVERFVRSRLCDRLRLLPASQLFAPESPEYDLLVTDASGKRYGIRFIAGLRSVPAPLRLQSKTTSERALDQLLTYDLESGKVNRRMPNLATLCA